MGKSKSGVRELPSGYDCLQEKIPLKDILHKDGGCSIFPLTLRAISYARKEDP